MTTLIEQNRINQQRHREKVISKIGIDEYKKKKAEEMKIYRAKRKEAEQEANPKPEVPKKSVSIPVINTNTKTLNIRQPKGLKYKVNKVVDIVPSYITRDTKLEPITIDNYINKINMINRIMNGSPISADVKAELLKLMNNRTFNEKVLFDNMKYLEDVEKVIKSLRTKYSNDNTFNSYCIAYTVILCHLPSLRSDYLRVTTLTKELTKKNQAKRDDNIAEP